MNFNHLYYFYMVVRHGSISAASRDIKVSQPSLSCQLKTFEESLGVALFDRRGKKLVLTPSGKSIYADAAQMFEISNSILQFANKNAHQNLPIRIGIADEIERPFTVTLVKALTKKWKKKDPPSISLTTGLNEDLLGKLRSWTVDAVLTNRPSSFGDLETIGTLILPIYLAVSGSYSAAKKNAILCSSLKDVFKILKGLGKGLALPSSRLKIREEIDLFMSKEKDLYSITFESDTLATIIRAIIDDIGVGFVPLGYMLREVLNGEITIFGPEEGIWKHTLFLMVKKGRSNAAGVAEIAQAFEDLKENIQNTSEKIQFSGSVDFFLKQIPKLF